MRHIEPIFMKSINMKLVVFLLIMASLNLVAKPKEDSDSLMIKRHKIYLHKERVNDQKLLTLVQQYPKLDAVDKLTKELNLMQTYKVKKKKFLIIGISTLLIPVVAGGIISNMEGKSSPVPLVKSLQQCGDFLLLFSFCKCLET